MGNERTVGRSDGRTLAVGAVGAVAMIIVLGAGPLGAQISTSSLLAADRAASDVSARSGFVTAFLGALAGDGALLWPGAPVVTGAVQVRRVLESQRGLDSVRITWQPLAVEVSSDSSFGVTWGVTAISRDKESPRLVRYITAWKREPGGWRIAAHVAIGSYPATPATLPTDLGSGPPPMLIRAGGAAAPFVAADIGFAQLAGDSGASRAFERFAAPEAVTFGGGGVLNRGPAAIGSSVKSDRPTHWAWRPVAGYAAPSGDLGFTIGHSEITPEGGAPNPGKYLTIWRRLPNGQVGFITDGGNARPSP